MTGAVHWALRLSLHTVGGMVCAKSLFAAFCHLRLDRRHEKHGQLVSCTGCAEQQRLLVDFLNISAVSLPRKSVPLRHMNGSPAR